MRKISEGVSGVLLDFPDVAKEIKPSFSLLVACARMRDKPSERKEDRTTSKRESGAYYDREATEKIGLCP